VYWLPVDHGAVVCIHKRKIEKGITLNSGNSRDIISGISTGISGKMPVGPMSFFTFNVHL